MRGVSTTFMFCELCIEPFDETEFNWPQALSNFIFWQQQSNKSLQAHRKSVKANGKK